MKLKDVHARKARVPVFTTHFKLPLYRKFLVKHTETVKGFSWGVGANHLDSLTDGMKRGGSERARTLAKPKSTGLHSKGAFKYNTIEFKSSYQFHLIQNKPLHHFSSLQSQIVTVHNVNNSTRQREPSKWGRSHPRPRNGGTHALLSNHPCRRLSQQRPRRSSTSTRVNYFPL